MENKLRNMVDKNLVELVIFMFSHGNKIGALRKWAKGPLHFNVYK